MSTTGLLSGPSLSGIRAVNPPGLLMDGDDTEIKFLRKGWVGVSLRGGMGISLRVVGEGG